MHLATAWFGVVLLDDGADTAPVAHRLFPSDPHAVADRLERLDAGLILDEERALAAQAGEAYTVGESRLAGLAGAAVSPPVDIGHLAHRMDVRPDLYKAALHELARRRIRVALSDPDRHVMEGVTALDEINDTINLLGERLTDWFGLHAPELVKESQDLGGLASAIAQTTDRAELAKRTGITAAADTLGSDISPAEGAAIQALAAAFVSTQLARHRIETHLDEAVRKLAPNVCVMVGPKLGGRLIHLAGGMRRLAMLPASTVQTLGAEKALFRHISHGTPPPKHGVIFMHPLVHRAHPSVRGRVARMFAAKLVIAARADATTGNMIAQGLKADVEARAHRAHATLRNRGPPRGRHPHQQGPPRGGHKGDRPPGGGRR